MTTISQTTYTFTVLHLSDDTFEDISDALDEATGGHAVGFVSEVTTHDVEDSEVPALLKTMGNDGSFFEDDLDGDN